MSKKIKYTLLGMVLGIVVGGALLFGFFSVYSGGGYSPIEVSLLTFLTPFTDLAFKTAFGTHAWSRNLLEGVCPGGSGGGIACIGIAIIGGHILDVVLYTLLGGIIGYLFWRFRVSRSLQSR